MSDGRSSYHPRTACFLALTSRPNKSQTLTPKNSDFLPNLRTGVWDYSFSSQAVPEPPLASQDDNQGACDGEATTLEGISRRGRRRPGGKSGNESIPKFMEQSLQEAQSQWQARVFQPIWRG